LGGAKSDPLQKLGFQFRIGGEEEDWERLLGLPQTRIAKSGTRARVVHTGNEKSRKRKKLRGGNRYPRIAKATGRGEKNGAKTKNKTSGTNKNVPVGSDRVKKDRKEQGMGKGEKGGTNKGERKKKRGNWPGMGLNRSEAPEKRGQENKRTEESWGLRDWSAAFLKQTKNAFLKKKMGGGSQKRERNTT